MVQYICNYCNIISSNKYNYNMHLKTNKHKKKYYEGSSINLKNNQNHLDNIF